MTVPTPLPRQEYERATQYLTVLEMSSVKPLQMVLNLTLMRRGNTIINVFCFMNFLDLRVVV